jgi:hypothetical protein
VLNAAVKQRAAELLADFERQSGQWFSFDRADVWKRAHTEAGRELQRAQERIRDRCFALGIPARFAPSLALVFHNRGHDNELDRSRKRLRSEARTRVEAIARKALAEIAAWSVAAQEALEGSLNDARQFIDRPPDIEVLMPTLRLREIANEPVPPPVPKLLISPNALRQRRYRARQRERDGNGFLPLRDADVTEDETLA